MSNNEAVLKLSNVPAYRWAFSQMDTNYVCELRKKYDNAGLFIFGDEWQALNISVRDEYLYIEGKTDTPILNFNEKIDRFYYEIILLLRTCEERVSHTFNPFGVGSIEDHIAQMRAEEGEFTQQNKRMELCEKIQTAYESVESAVEKTL